MKIFSYIFEWILFVLEVVMFACLFLGNAILIKYNAFSSPVMKMGPLSIILSVLLGVAVILFLVIASSEILARQWENIKYGRRV